MFRVRTKFVSFLPVLLALACGAEGSESGPSVGPSSPPEQYAPTDTSVLNVEQQAELSQLSAALKASETLDADGLLAKRRVEHVESLGYDPLQSEFIDTIQGSALGLSESELAKLQENGFVISTRQSFATFLRGYAAIYSEHLPVYISADTILEAVHSSYDDILLSVERAALIPMLGELLASMHGKLATSDFDAQTRADVDVYLSVARSLLAGNFSEPSMGGDASAARALFDLARAAEGWKQAELFGVKRDVDASQFVPRGHYEDEEDLRNYFRAMMWLGRIDLRLIETQPDGSSLFRRAQYDAMLQLRALMDDSDDDHWTKIDTALRAFVGESDYMVVPEVDALIADLGGMAAARAATDDEAEAAIANGGYGLQQISSHIMVNGGNVETLPLSRSFLLFGQRYVLDSHVFSQVVYDRVGLRMMPSPLDAAYAAMGNDAALPLLDAELRTHTRYPGALDGARILADAHGEEFWESNLYNLWLGSLRALSPAADVSDPSAVGMPQVTGTEAWNRRILNTQLGSWAELRHDTLLYAKQSYTGVPACDYPDAYVDPYPEFFAKLVRFAQRGSELAEILAADRESSASYIADYFNNLESSMAILQGMAQNQREGTPFTEDQMAFINRAVRVVEESVGCATVNVPDGWLAHLYFQRDKSIEFDPTIADVHTQPADESGNPVGKVLHVATGFPRFMVITADTCMGPRAYAGVSFAYHEKITEDFQRVTDSQWAEELSSTTPPDVPWLTPILGE